MVLAYMIPKSILILSIYIYTTFPPPIEKCSPSRAMFEETVDELVKRVHSAES